MASDADIRAVLREHGIEVPKRGKLGDRHYKAYDEIRGQGGTPDSADSWEGPDDDGDIITATVPAGPGDQAPADDEPAEPVTERRPRKVRSNKDHPGKTPAERFANRWRGKATAGGKKRPRMPVDRLISRSWGIGARLIAPVSGATARTLMLQAPVAGLILEDTVKDTVVDTFLQPAVRAEEAAERVFALAGPPLIVMAIERAQGLEEPARQMRLAVLVPMLEEALGMWIKIAGDKMEEAAERVEANAATQDEINRLTGLIFPQAEVSEEEPAADMAGATA